MHNDYDTIADLGVIDRRAGNVRVLVTSFSGLTRTTLLVLNREGAPRFTLHLTPLQSEHLQELLGDAQRLL